jgi:transposase
MKITTIGLDIAKNVFQVHGIDAAEKVVVRKQLRRGQVLAFFRALPRCLIGIEACATSHRWARELTKLGHQVRLMPAKDVKAYVKRNKNDAADARGDLQGGTAADHAFCSDQIGRAAGAADGASRAGPFDAAAELWLRKGAKGSRSC